jgi:hypothetical protein
VSQLTLYNAGNRAPPLPDEIVVGWRIGGDDVGPVRSPGGGSGGQTGRRVRGPGLQLPRRHQGRPRREARRIRDVPASAFFLLPSAFPLFRPPELRRLWRHLSEPIHIMQRVNVVSFTPYLSAIPAKSGIVADVAPPERADFPAGELQRCRAAGAETWREENSSFAGTARYAVPAYRTAVAHHGRCGRRCGPSSSCRCCPIRCPLRASRFLLP